MSKRLHGVTRLLLPLPIVVIGTQLADQVNWMTIGHIGMLGHRPPVLGAGIGKQSVTSERIRACGGFSVNIPSGKLVAAAEYVGTVSSRDSDKAGVFTAFYGKLGTVPMAEECPINLECKLVAVHDLGTILACYGEIVETYVTKDCHTDGLVDISKVDPVLISLPQRQYRRVGGVMAPAFEIGKTYRRD
jgi:flavin reductase (DIM6/NTAB) family NADH-FMN oxidoreductase RutF